MKKSIFIKSALIAATLPFFAGCVEREVVYRDRPAPGTVIVEQPSEPPPPQTEIITVAPGPLALWFWAPGCWEWRGHWVWNGGHWIARPHPRAVWVSSGWVHRGHGHVWVAGHWR